MDNETKLIEQIESIIKENSLLKERIWKLELIVHKKNMITFFKEKEYDIDDLGITIEKDNQGKPVYTKEGPLLYIKENNHLEGKFIFEWFIEIIGKEALKELINPLKIFKGRTKLMDYKIKLSNISIDDFGTLEFSFGNVPYPYNKHILKAEDFKIMFSESGKFEEELFKEHIKKCTIQSIEQMIKYKNGKTRIV